MRKRQEWKFKQLMASLDHLQQTAMTAPRRGCSIPPPFRQSGTADSEWVFTANKITP